MARTKQTARFSGARRSTHICGLYYNDAEQHRHYLPQVKLDSHTLVNPVCFETRLQQTFENPSKDDIAHVRYTFPLYDGVTVTGYTITFGEETLKGIVKQKEVAKEIYDSAVAKGETAGLLETLPSGIFGVTLGNLPAKTDVIVHITYCGELKHDAAIDGLRYTLPTSVAPRYGSYPDQVLGSSAFNRGGISITVDFATGSSAIRKMQSPSHPIAVSMGALSTDGVAGAFNSGKASGTLTLGSAELADDFVLQLLIDDLSKPQAILEKHPTLQSRAIMTTLVPRFNLEPIHPEIVFIADQSGSMSGSKNEALVAALKVFLKSLPLGVRFNICPFGNRFEFLWEKSQAYNETNLQKAIAFVSGLTASYGGTEMFEPLKETFERRHKDLPLEVMLLTDGEIWGEQRVFEYINSQVHAEGADARVFALGIGSDVSHTLVEGIARAGDGFAQFVTQNEETDQKVVRMLRGALYPHTTDYSVEISYDRKAKDEGMTVEDEDSDYELVDKVNDCLVLDEGPPQSTQTRDTAETAPKAISFFDESAELDPPPQSKDSTVDRYAHLPGIQTPKLLQTPSNIPPMFPFNRTTFYLLLGDETTNRKVSAVTLRARSPQGPLELKINVDSEERDGTTVHQLAARKAIQELEEGRGWLQVAKTNDGEGTLVKTKYASRFDEIVEREAVRIGEKYQVAGKWCSFVAVKANEGKSEDEEMEQTEAVAEDATNGPVRKRKGLGVGGRFRHRKVAPEVHALPPNPPPRRQLASKAARSSAPSTAPVMPLADEDEDEDMGFALMGEAASMPLADEEDEDEDMGFALMDGPSAPSFASAQFCAPSPAFGASTNYGGGPSALFGSSSAAPAGFGGQSATTKRSVAAFSPKPTAFGAVSASSTSVTSPQQTDLARFKSVAKAPSTASVLHQIIALQTFSGAWQWNDSLFQLLGRSPTFDSVFESQDVMATALAVGYLEEALKDKQEVWEMIAAKARAWMNGSVGESTDELIFKAKGLLGV